MRAKRLDEAIKMSLKHWVWMHKHLSILLAMMLLLGLFVSVAPLAVCKDDRDGRDNGRDNGRGAVLYGHVW